MTSWPDHACLLVAVMDINLKKGMQVACLAVHFQGPRLWQAVVILRLWLDSIIFSRETVYAHRSLQHSSFMAVCTKVLAGA